MRLAAGSILLLLAALPSRAEAVSDDWFAIFVGGSKSGWNHIRTEPVDGEDGVAFVTINELAMSVRRAGTPMKLRVRDRILEDAKGRVVRFRREQDIGGGRSVIAGSLREDGRLRLDIDGRIRVIESPEGALGPAALARRLRETGLEQGTRVRTPVFSLDSLGREVVQEDVVGPREEIEILGRKLSLRRVTSTFSKLAALRTVSWVDEEGRALRVDAISGGEEMMRSIRVTEALAKRPGEPAEVFADTLIRPERGVPDPRRGGRAVYRLRARSGETADLPEGVGQTVTREEDGSLRVVVDVKPPAPERPVPIPWPPEKARPLLEPTPLLESDDPVVRRFASEAVGAERNAVKAARAIEAHVRKKIVVKSLAVGFASAAQTARRLEGDCTEHAALAAAMARAVGLPSRVVLGLVYIPGRPRPDRTLEVGVFGYHMWTEVLVGEETWMAIDAAIGSMDRTHIALSRSDLAEVGSFLDLALPLLDRMNNLDIEVVEAG